MQRKSDSKYFETESESRMRIRKWRDKNPTFQKKSDFENFDNSKETLTEI